MEPATKKQLSYLLDLINRVEGSDHSYLSQTKFIRENGTMAERSGRISKAAASAWIRNFKAKADR